MHLKKKMQSEMRCGKWTQVQDKQVKPVLPYRTYVQIKITVRHP
jgi:hypothetical protein